MTKSEETVSIKPSSHEKTLHLLHLHLRLYFFKDKAQKYGGNIETTVLETVLSCSVTLSLTS